MKPELALVKKCVHVCVCLKYVNTVDVVVHINNLGNTKYISSRNQYYWVRVLSLKPYVHKHAN